VKGVWVWGLATQGDASWTVKKGDKVTSGDLEPTWSEDLKGGGHQGWVGLFNINLQRSTCYLELKFVPYQHVG